MVTMLQAMLQELQQGRLAIEVDLSHAASGPLENHIFEQVRRVAGYERKRAHLYSPDGIVARLNRGQGSFYFIHLEASGVPRSLTRIRGLLTRFPKCRSVILLYSKKATVQLAGGAPDYTLLHMKPFGEISAK